MKDYQTYDNPLIQRYASRKMAHLWSPQVKFSTWRRLWVALAEAERELGLNITDEQVDALRAQVETIDFAAAEHYERRLRHDVMAHVHAYGDAAPDARAIIHLGATSCYVTDNTDLILLARGARHGPRPARRRDRRPGRVRRPLEGPALPGLHPLPARPARDRRQAGDPLVLRADPRPWRDRAPAGRPPVPRREGHDRHAGELPRPLRRRPRRRSRRSTEKVAAAFGFDKLLPGRRPDLFAEGRFADRRRAGRPSPRSAHRFGMDLRLLAHEREVEEPFEAEQIGSSAMAYKRNPMRAERMCSLARFVMGLPTADRQTRRRPSGSSGRSTTAPSVGWCCPRRSWRSTPSSTCTLNVVPGLVVHPPRIAAHIAEQLPFMATENLLMAGGAGRRRPPGPPRADPGPLARRRGPAQGGRGRQRPDRAAWRRTPPSLPSISPGSGPVEVHRPLGPSRSTSSSRPKSSRSAAATRGEQKPRPRSASDPRGSRDRRRRTTKGRGAG